MNLGKVTSSIMDYIKTKCTNPFFSTLLVVWSFSNWRLLYTIFNFDKGESLENKITFISGYLDEPKSIYNLLICIVIAFVVLISSYLLTNASRFITEVSNEVVNPWIFNIIHKITEKTGTISKKRFEKLSIDRDEYKSRYEAEREKRLLVEKERDDIEAKYKEMQIRELN